MPKISDLLDASALAGDELLYLLQAGQDRRINVSDLIAGLTPLTGGGSDTSTLPPLLYYATAGYVPGSGGDDYPALSAAMADGGRVRLPKGQLLISSPISIPTGAYIVGAGTVIRPSASMTTMLTHTGQGYISGVTCSNQSSLATNAFAITKAKDNTRLSIIDCEAIGFPSGSGWLVTNGDVIRWERPRTDTCGTSINLQNGGMNSAIVEPYFVLGNGIDVGLFTTVQCEGLQIIGGQILPSTAGAFAARLKSGLSISFLGVIFDQIAASGANAVLLDSSGAAIKHVSFDACWFGKNAVASGTGSLVKLIPGDNEGIYFTNCSWQDAGAYGLELTVGTGGLSQDIVVSGGRFVGSSSGDASLNNCRAIFVGVEFNHSTSTISCGGSQASYSDIACRNNGIGFQAPSLVSLSTIHFSPGAALRLGDPLVVSAGGFDVTGTSLVRGVFVATGTITGSNIGVGSGDPEGAIPATPGTLYQRLDPTAGLTDHTLFVKDTGTGATGWHAFATQDFATRQIANSLPSIPANSLYGGSGAAGAAQQATPSGALSLSGGNLTVRTATASLTGISFPDNSTITVDGTGKLSARAGIGFVNVKDFGAKGDGTTDDTSAFNSAISYAQTNKQGIRVPGGNYILSAQLAWTTGAISFKGEGQGLTILTWTAAAATRGIAVTLDQDIHPVTICDLTLQTLGTTGSAITVDASGQIISGTTVNRKAPRFVFRDLNVRGGSDPFNNYWGLGLDVISALIGVVDNFNFEGGYTNGTGTTTPYKSLVGVRFRGSGHPCQFVVSNSSFYGVLTAIEADGCEGLHVTMTNCVGVTTGVLFDDSADVGARPLCVVTACHINANSSCVYIHNGSEFLIIGNDLYRCSDDPAGAGAGTGVYVDGTYTTAGVISGNNFSNSHASETMNGITLANARNAIIDSNVFRKYQSTSAMNGISISGSCTNIKIGDGNHFTVDVGTTGSFGYAISDLGIKTSVVGAFVLLSKSANQAIAAATSTAITWTTVEDFKGNNGLWASGTPSVVTVSVDGLYRIAAGVVWDTTGGGTREILVFVNGSGRPGAPQRLESGGTAGNFLIQNISSGPLRLTAGSNIVLYAITSVAASVLTNSGTFLSVERICDG